MDINQLFIVNLKKWRKIKGLTQDRLAEKCKTAHSYIRQLETGNRSPSFAFIGKIADALQIEPYQLFFNETSKSVKSARTRQLESMQKNLIDSVSNEIQTAFDEIKKY